MFQEIRDPATGHLLAKIDPQRRLLELKRNGKLVLVDLAPYLEGNNPPATVEGNAVKQQN